MENIKFEDHVYEVLSESLFSHIKSESDRGFVLIATSCIDDFMLKIFESILPKDLNTRGKKKQIFGYPGCLDSLSAKVELSYICRLIDKKVYSAINILRKIRNNLAHGSMKFSIKDEEKLLELYNTLNITDEDTNLLIQEMFGQTLKYVGDNQDNTLLKTLEILDVSGHSLEQMISEFKKVENSTIRSDKEIENAILSVISDYLDESREQVIRDFRKQIEQEHYFWRFKLFVCTCEICISIMESIHAIKQIYPENQNIIDIAKKIT